MNNQNVHPIHILYSVIALTVVVWSVLYYQVRNAEPTMVQNIDTSDSRSSISKEERARVMAEMNATDSPPLSQAERAKIKKEMEKPENSPTISAEERARVQQELNK